MRLECAMLVGIPAPVSSCSSTRGTTKIRVSSMSGVVIDGRSGCAVRIHLLVFMAIDLAFEKPSASVFAYSLFGGGGFWIPTGKSPNAGEEVFLFFGHGERCEWKRDV